jgi:hypothetical protein
VFACVVCGDVKWYFCGKEHDAGMIEFVITDLPNGLPMPDLSFPKNVVPPWNTTNHYFLEYLFSFCTFFLHDDGALLIFYPNDPRCSNRLVPT